MFELGKEIRRRGIHEMYGGQQQGGMSTPSLHSIILLFTGEGGGQYGYEDKFNADGVYWYTGEGQTGDMQLVRANKALDEHKRSGKRVFLFEQVRKATVRFLSEVECVGHHYEPRPDRNGAMRKAIVFHLVFLPASDGQEQVEMRQNPNTGDVGKLASLRRRAIESQSTTLSVVERLAIVRRRAEAVRLYALERAKGTCEGCEKPAPFETRTGPFLEVHHVFRVADGGPDHPSCVTALCPNCHREVHYGKAAHQLNGKLISFLCEKEGPPPALLHPSHT